MPPVTNDTKYQIDKQRTDSEFKENFLESIIFNVINTIIIRNC